MKFSRESFYPLRSKLKVFDIENIISKKIIDSKIEDHEVLITNISSKNLFFENSISPLEAINLPINIILLFS